LSPPRNNNPVLPLGQTISAKNPGDAATLAAAFAACAAENRDFSYSTHAQAGTFRIDAASFQELAARVARVSAAAGVELTNGQVEFHPCWTPARLAEAGHRLGSADGDSGDFAVVRLRVSPRRSGEGNVFESEFAGPPEIDALNAAVARGVARVSSEGVDSEGPIIDTQVVFIDGAFHAKRSTPEGFEEAAVTAMQAACRTAGLRRLEPLVEIEIMAERDLVLPVVNDLAQHSGSELRRRLAPKGVVVTAELPLSALPTYEQTLATISRGKAKLIAEPRLARWAEVRRR